MRHHRVVKVARNLQLLVAGLVRGHHTLDSLLGEERRGKVAFAKVGQDDDDEPAGILRA